MDFLNAEIPSSEGTSLPQTSYSELIQHFTPSPSEDFSGSFWQTLPNAPPPPVGGRSAFPSLPLPAGTSTNYPQNAMADNSTGSWNPYREGTNGAESWLAGCVSSFAAVPEILPVCFDSCIPENLLTSKQHSRFHLLPQLWPSQQTGSRYHRGATTKGQNSWTSNGHSLSTLAPRSTQGSTSEMHSA